LLGDTFTMADVIFGGTVRYMLGFKMLEPRATFTAYSERLAQRPAFQRSQERNAKVREEHGI
jgi:glutathione S-transferase